LLGSDISFRQEELETRDREHGCDGSRERRSEELSAAPFEAVAAGGFVEVYWHRGRRKGWRFE